MTSCCGPPTTARPRTSGTAAAATPSSPASRRGTGWRARRRPGTATGTSPQAPQAISSATTTCCWTAAAGCRPSRPTSSWATSRSRRRPELDGYPQRFGIPEGLYAEPVAVKQGWFCCWNGGNQLHVSTGVIGPDRRYVMAMGSLEPDRCRGGARQDDPGRQDDVPRRQDLGLVVAEQIGSALAGSIQALLAPPSRQLRVVAGQQHFGHVAAPASSAVGCSSALRADRRSVNRIGVTRDCPTRREAGERPPRSSPAPPTRRRAARSHRWTPPRPASAAPRRPSRAGRYPRSARRRTPGATHRPSVARSPG